MKHIPTWPEWWAEKLKNVPTKFPKPVVVYEPEPEEDHFYMKPNDERPLYEVMR